MSASWGTKAEDKPLSPQTNGQCERFNGTLLNMLGTLTPEQKKDWKSHVPALVHAYNCTRNTATGFSHTFCYLAGSLYFQWMWNLDYKGEAIGVPLGSPITYPN